MMACLDVDYREDGAVAAAVLFEAWTDARPAGERVARVTDVAPYEPGAFYKRELPCLLAVLERSPPLDLVVIDGYVWLGKDHPGLGMHLYEALGARVPVVGIAKTSFHENDEALPVLRGQSLKPLFVTAAGVSATDACAWVRSMHGPYRIATLLARVDRLCRT